MTKVQAQPGDPRLTCASATTVASAYNQRKATKSIPTTSSFTWAAHVGEVTLEDSVIVTLTPAR